MCREENSWLGELQSTTELPDSPRPLSTCERAFEGIHFSKYLLLHFAFQNICFCISSLLLFNIFAFKIFALHFKIFAFQCILHLISFPFHSIFVFQDLYLVCISKYLLLHFKTFAFQYVCFQDFCFCASNHICESG